MKTLRGIIFLFFPVFLSAGILDWFYTAPEKATQFECSHRCGEWGTAGMHHVEWQAVLALWELDQMGYAFSGEPSPYPRPPESFKDPSLRAV